MELTIEQALRQGVAAHKEGKVQDAERFYRAILQSQPLHPDANHNLGVLAVSVNKADAALPLFKTALEANPKVEQFWLSYIDALIKEKQFDNAKQVSEQAKKHGVDGERLISIGAQLPPKTEKPNTAGASPPQELLNSLVVHYQNRRLSDAETLAISITQDFPEHQFAWKVLGAVLGATGRNLEAVDVNQTAVALSPKDAAAHYNLGNTLQELGRLDDALASYNQAIALKPDYAKAHSNLGNTLRELGRSDEALASYTQAIALEPDYAEAHSNLGVTLQEVGRLDEAEASYTQAIALKPDFSEAHYNLGVTLQGLGRSDEALASYTQAIALKPDHAEAHSHLGITLQELGRLDEALASHTQAIALKPDYAEAHSNLGVTLKELGRLEEALASYNQAIAVKPDFAEAHSNLGNTLQEVGRLDAAVACYTQAIALNPDYAKAHSNLGAALEELGRLDEAEASYNQAIVLNPDNALAHFGLSKMLYNKRNEDLALNSIVKANEIEPKSKDYELIMRFMEARKSRKEKEAVIGDTISIGAFTGLGSNPLILNRSVEAELITSLYEMNSMQLDKTKRVGLLASGKRDPRYGNGMVSPDFNLFGDARSSIQKVAEDLKKIMMKAVKSDIYIIDSFFNILRAGGGTTPHAHLSGLDRNIALGLGKQKYSLVYYLSVGDQNCIEPGILKLYEPGEDIRPREGMILIFPASRKHSAVYSGKTDRVMIGANFYSL